uniref:Putative secreted protein n=1 Tax=Ixodes ricinus TaxID=34613 RepID=A0A6B0U0R8_IXORI
MRRGSGSCFAIWVRWGGARASCAVRCWLVRPVLQLQRRIGFGAGGAHSPGPRHVSPRPCWASRGISGSLSCVLRLTLAAVGASSGRALV